MTRPTLSVWQATWTVVWSEVWNAVGQLAFVQSAPAPSHPLKYPKPEETEKEWGGISEISVLEPLPGDVGFTRVVSMSVQPSPLRPQEPVCKYAMAEMKGPFEVKSPPVDKMFPF